MPFTETTWARPARRMSSIKSCRTYLPGVQNKKGLDKMVVIVDTSGSCFNEEELSMFCTEIDSIQSQTGVELALIFADTDVQSEFVVKNDGISLLDKIKSGMVKAAGGGGTDMVKPFLYSLKKYKPVLTVICSDGYTPYPTKQDAKKTNLLWVVNTNVDIPKECGKALYIHPA
jgi:predicted metal-dependent peptidase